MFCTIKIPGISKTTISELHQRLAREALGRRRNRVAWSTWWGVAVREKSNCGFWDVWLAKGAQERERRRWALAGRSSHTSAAGKNVPKSHMKVFSNSRTSPLPINTLGELCIPTKHTHTHTSLKDSLPKTPNGCDD